MAVKLRLTRVGKTKQPQYRVIAADSRRARDGRFIEILGQYNPRTEPSTLALNEERIRYWIGVGAQPSDTVHRLLHAQGLTTVEPRKQATKPSRAEREAAEAAAKAAAEAREAEIGRAHV